jgi:hypothetical protein
MQPAPQRFSPGSEISSRTATQGYAQIPNSIIENQAMLTPAELALALIVLRRGENTVSDKNWVDWTGKDPRMKEYAIRGLKDKGCLHVRGRGQRAKYYFERDKWDFLVRSRPRHERARTLGRSRSVTAKTGMQVHQECRERGCARLCESQVIPFPTTEVAKPVSQREWAAPPGEAVKLPPTPGADAPKVEPSPPPKGGWELTLSAIRQYFPHVGPEFVEKLRLECIIKGQKQFTDAKLAAAVHEARKARRNQQTEGLFLLTVPAYLATVISTGAHLTHDQKRELKQAREVLVNPGEWPEDAIEQAREILNKYGG